MRTPEAVRLRNRIALADAGVSLEFDPGHLGDISNAQRPVAVAGHVPSDAPPFEPDASVIVEEARRAFRELRDAL